MNKVKAGVVHIQYIWAAVIAFSCPSPASLEKLMANIEWIYCSWEQYTIKNTSDNQKYTHNQYQKKKVIIYSTAL